MGRDTAAEYLDTSLNSLYRMGRAGDIPAPFYFKGQPSRPMWAREDLDAAIAKAAGHRAKRGKT
jgi:hypothetical protein